MRMKHLFLYLLLVKTPWGRSDCWNPIALGFSLFDGKTWSVSKIMSSSIMKMLILEKKNHFFIWLDRWMSKSKAMDLGQRQLELPPAWAPSWGWLSSPLRGFLFVYHDSHYPMDQRFMIREISTWLGRYSGMIRTSIIQSSLFPHHVKFSNSSEASTIDPISVIYTKNKSCTNSDKTQRYVPAFFM